ncbi:hypothetical protein AU106_gp255 [Sinorhizobium phage phiM9]|uniref:Uncharacterized protein n=1 Tax=Sinorhizobium phage phiM9 TaxID=1636182 RepID=A0A0F6TGS1_9CAUD|nr:hypothetical protein AU106_gp255 [Sinorhizobium phage phiM9]AKE44886.1 hypothetical protein Sm_phiM9_259 [Sinorhizobium phage phiM9]
MIPSLSMDLFAVPQNTMNRPVSELHSETRCEIEFLWPDVFIA